MLTPTPSTPQQSSVWSTFGDQPQSKPKHKKKPLALHSSSASTIVTNMSSLSTVSRTRHRRGKRSFMDCMDFEGMVLKSETIRAATFRKLTILPIIPVIVLGLSSMYMMTYSISDVIQYNENMASIEVNE